MHHCHWLSAAALAILLSAPAYAGDQNQAAKVAERLGPPSTVSTDDLLNDDKAIADRLSNAPVRSLRGASDIRLPNSPRGHEAEIFKSVLVRPSLLLDIKFKGASDVMAGDSGNRLAKLAAALSDHRLANKRILIGAQTDLLGSDAYNAEVADLRAHAIADALSKRFGVTAERLETVGFGRIKNADGGSTIRLVNIGAFDGKTDAKVTAPVAHRAGAKSLPASAIAHAPPSRFVAERASELPTEAAPSSRRGTQRRDRGEPASATDNPDPLYGESPGASGSGAGGAGAGGAGAGGGGGGGGAWSDRRLKRNIVRLGETAAGLPLYRFEYIWGGPVYVGVMAQDIATLRPDALITDASGYYRVDYDKLGLRLETLEDYERRLRGKAA
jgi:outer membrane protein OmpA-like peptidoglycan-associated protein